MSYEKENRIYNILYIYAWFNARTDCYLYNHEGATVEVELGDDIVSLCNHFAELTYLSNLDEYSRRGQNNPDKIKLDIAQGKAAEFAVMYYLIEEGHGKVSIPDMTLHRKKSFDPDLTTSRYNIHVKSQSQDSYSKYGQSFLFQKKDPLVKNPKENDRIATVLCSGLYIFHITKLLNPLQLNWQEPRVVKLRDTKVAIYL